MFAGWHLAPGMPSTLLAIQQYTSRQKNIPIQNHHKRIKVLKRSDDNP